jgi:hypothetical protein
LQQAEAEAASVIVVLPAFDREPTAAQEAVPAPLLPLLNKTVD